MVLRIIIFTIVAGVGGTGIGGILGSLVKKNSLRAMSLLLSFAGGIMLSVVCFDLFPESIANAQSFFSQYTDFEGWGAIFTVIIVIIGVAIIFLLNFFIDKHSEKKNNHFDETHPKTADDLDEITHSKTLIKEINEKASMRQLMNAGLVMVIAIALHNFPEGLSIGASYSSEVKSGIILAIIIAIHNIPEGMAIVAPLICGGMKKGKAITLTALSGAPTIIGALVGYSIGGMGSIGLAISLALASGAMVYVVFGEIIPQAFLMYRSKLPTFFIILGVLLGVILIYVI